MSDLNCNPPSGIATLLTRTGCVNKAHVPFVKLMILGILAGAYIGFGASIATLVSSDLAKYVGVGLAKVATGSVFSIGLILVILAGAELFTGNNLMVMSVFDKKVSLNRVLVKWGIVFAANFIGSVLVAYLMFKTDLWQGKGFLTGIQALKIANAKVNLSFGAALTRGICCNWLVCLAVWMAFASKNVIGKIAAIYFPIMTFVALGLEHSIANMYFIPIGLFLKGTEAATASGLNLANLTWGNFFTVNLLPVTIGNVIGGAFFVGFLYWQVYVKGTE